MAKYCDDDRYETCYLRECWDAQVREWRYCMRHAKTRKSIEKYKKLLKGIGYESIED